MPCGWEGNRRSGVALAIRHRLQWFIHLRAHGLDREMSTYTPHGAWHTSLYFACDALSILECYVYVIDILDYVILVMTCLQCFDTVGWASGRAPGL